MANNQSKGGFRKFLTILTGLLAFIAAILLGSNVSGTEKCRNSIKSGIAETVSEFREQTGAEYVDVQIFEDPGHSILTSANSVTYNVFLTAKVSNLHTKSREDWREILVHSKEKPTRMWGSTGDYAYYNWSVEVPVLAKHCRILPNVTDGRTTFCLKKPDSSSVFLLTEGSTREQLNLQAGSKAVRAFGWILAFLAAALFLLLSKGKKNTGEPDRNTCLAEVRKLSGEPLTGTGPASGSLRNIMQEIDAGIGKTQLEAKAAAGKKKYLVIAAVCAAAVIALIIVNDKVVKPSRKYAEASELLASGNAGEAMDMYRSLGSYQDCAGICRDYDLNAADRLHSEGDCGAAYCIYRCYPDHTPAAEAAEDLLKEHPVLAVFDLKENDEFTLGTFPQEEGQDKTPIEWIVLSNNKGELTAVSKKILESRPYDRSAADRKMLKSWLMEDFCSTAFSEEEKTLVAKAGVMSLEKVKLLDKLRGDVKTSATWYAGHYRREGNINIRDDWWINAYNTPAKSMYIVTGDGKYSNYADETEHYCGVRPMLILNATGTKADYYLDDYEEMNAGSDESPAAVEMAAEKPSSGKSAGNSSGKSGSVSAGKKKCSRCNGTGKVTKHFGKTWNKKPGYQYGKTCGACGGTGYVK